MTLILIFFSLHFRWNWTWRLLSCIFGHGEKPPWWKHGSPSLWGYTSGNVWHSCLCFFHLRQSMFLFSNLFKLWNFWYMYSFLHVEWPFFRVAWFKSPLQWSKKIVLFSFRFQILHKKVDIFYFNHFLISCLIN